MSADTAYAPLGEEPATPLSTEREVAEVTIDLADGAPEAESDGVVIKVRCIILCGPIPWRGGAKTAVTGGLTVAPARTAV